MFIHDIVEKNGRTIKENNLELGHNISVGDLVEVKIERWHGDGACEKTLARLWVVLAGRDCDGTPLYWLSKANPNNKRDKVLLYYPDSSFGGPEHRLPGGLPGMMFNEKFTRKVVDDWQGGFPEESLTVVEVTQRLRDGYGSLTWDEDRGY